MLDHYCRRWAFSQEPIGGPVISLTLFIGIERERVNLYCCKLLSSSASICMRRSDSNNDVTSCGDGKLGTGDLHGILFAVSRGWQKQARRCVSHRPRACSHGQLRLFFFSRYIIFIYLFTNDKGRLAPLTCHIVHQTLKSLDNSIKTKARKYDIKIARPTK